MSARAALTWDLYARVPTSRLAFLDTFDIRPFFACLTFVQKKLGLEHCQGRPGRSALPPSAPCTAPAAQRSCGCRSASQSAVWQAFTLEPSLLPSSCLCLVHQAVLLDAVPQRLPHHLHCLPVGFIHAAQLAV